MTNRRINTKGKRLGFITGVLLGICSKGRKLSTGNFLKGQFKTSTQHMGVRFSGKVRKVFRARWLRFGK